MKNNNTFYLMIDIRCLETFSLPTDMVTLILNKAQVLDINFITNEWIEKYNLKELSNEREG